ncbi:hypothetical protein D3C75_766180 [compost metagenome]
MRDLRLDHVAAAHRREVVAVGPVLRLVLDVDVELAGLEGFEGHRAVAIELVLDAVDVVLAAVDRQVLAPVVLHPFKHQPAPRLDLGDAVGAAAQRRLEGGGLEVALLPVVLGQHRHFAQAQDQQRVAGALEHEADAQRAENVHPLHFLQVGAVDRVAILEQRAVREGHVSRGDGLAVMPAGFGAQVEHHPAAVLAVLHRAGDQAVAGGRFVAGRVVLAGADHQRLVQFADAVLLEIGRGNRARPLEGVGVEGVEGTESHGPQGAALGRLRVDPVEMGECGWVLERAELRVSVAFAHHRGCGKAQGQAE